MPPCPECQEPISRHADACPHCGRPRADILETRRREAEQLENTARLCAIVMPLAALAAFCFTSIPATFLSALKLLGSNLAAGCVQLLAVVLYSLLALAFFALPIITLIYLVKATVRCMQNR